MAIKLGNTEIRSYEDKVGLMVPKTVVCIPTDKPTKIRKLFGDRNIKVKLVVEYMNFEGEMFFSDLEATVEEYIVIGHNVEYILLETKDTDYDSSSVNAKETWIKVKVVGKDGSIVEHFIEDTYCLSCEPQMVLLLRIVN